jgi:hypothetical protein
VWERRQALAEAVAQMSIPRTLTPVPVSRHHAVCMIQLNKFLAGAGGVRRGLRVEERVHRGEPEARQQTRAPSELSARARPVVLFCLG